jgi:hypothetical protein
MLQSKQNLKGNDYATKISHYSTYTASGFFL